MKKEPASDPQQSASADAEYEKHVGFLQRSYKSKKWSVASMASLMDQMAQKRRDWIHNDGLSVKDILEQFPCLSDVRIVSYRQYIPIPSGLSFVGGLYQAPTVTPIPSISPAQIKMERIQVPLPLSMCEFT